MDSSTITIPYSPFENRAHIIDKIRSTISDVFNSLGWSDLRERDISYYGYISEDSSLVFEIYDHILPEQKAFNSLSGSSRLKEMGLTCIKVGAADASDMGGFGVTEISFKVDTEVLDSYFKGFED